MIREGSIRRDLKEIVSQILTNQTYTSRLMFCSDGLDPIDIENYGHIDHCVRESIKLGMKPIDAISIASRNCFDYYKMGNDFGGIGPGKVADILILDDYKKIKINKVVLGGKIVVSNGKLVVKIHTPKVPTWMKKTVRIPKLQPKSFNVTSKNNVETVNTIFYESEYLVEKHNHNNGKIIHEKGKIKITCKNGYLLIKNLKIEGKRRMDTESLLNGFKIEKYEMVK